MSSFKHSHGFFLSPSPPSLHLSPRCAFELSGDIKKRSYGDLQGVAEVYLSDKSICPISAAPRAKHYQLNKQITKWAETNNPLCLSTFARRVGDEAVVLLQ